MIFKKLYLTHRWDSKQLLPLWVIVDLGVMAIEEYSTFPRSAELELTSSFHDTF